ncbi:hypothetical protein BC826DRAFT_521994 [Russula brevipes]|nr:hypothetical protein BC826DRAFT_521994 [Russula brevipes]
MGSVCRGIPANPDISGIGIRASFYTTVFIKSGIRILPAQLVSKGMTETIKKLQDGLNQSVGLTGLGFIFTAVIETIQNRLDLYHAILVSQLLLYIATMEYVPRVIEIFSQSEVQFRSEAIVHIAMAAVLAVWSTYVYLNSATFGSTPECNADVKFVTFYFGSVSATAPWMRTSTVIAVVVVTISVIIGIVLWIRPKLLKQIGRKFEIKNKQAIIAASRLALAG